MGRRILVIANHTLGAPQLTAAIADRLTAGEAEIHLLVPATHPRHPSPSDPEGYPDPVLEGDTVGRTSWERARSRLYVELDRLHAGGTPATGEVCDHDPLDAVRKLTATQAFDEIVLSTLAPGLSRWLKMDLPSRLQRAVSVPVTVIIAPEDDD